VTRSAKQSTTTQAVKENVVDGVLQNYLDQLLVTATEPQRLEKTIQISEQEIDLEPVIVEPILSVPEPVVAEPVVAEPVVVESVENKVEKESRHLTDQESWSSQGVECLIFNVCGLKLAVPLLYLGGVHEVKAEDVKPLMGQPSWYLGMVHTDEVNLQVIDTANFIMAERQQDLAEQGFKYLIQLEKTPWAIACQSIDDTVRLESTEIKWRGDRGKRTWLAGTVIEKMCALVDVSGLLQRVESSCKPV
jgi:purine-binding chemotaxis protein CheW